MQVADSETIKQLFVTIYRPLCCVEGGSYHRAGESESEPGAVEPSIFSGAGTGGGAFLNISLEPEQQKFY